MHGDSHLLYADDLSFFSQTIKFEIDLREDDANDSLLKHLLFTLLLDRFPIMQ